MPHDDAYQSQYTFLLRLALYAFTSDYFLLVTCMPQWVEHRRHKSIYIVCACGVYVCVCVCVCVCVGDFRILLLEVAQLNVANK